MAHSDFSPSSAMRWVACPESIRRTRSWVSAPGGSAAASEGTLAHEVAALALGLRDKLSLDSLREVAPEGVTDEMLLGAIEYAAYVYDVGPFLTSAVESPLTSADGVVFGTPDFIGLGTDAAIHVVDYKFGRGVRVSPKYNPQLMTYAWLFVESEGLDAQPDLEVVLHVYQPRFAGASVFSLTFGEIAQFRENQRAIAQLVNNSTVRFAAIPGEHCQFCPVKYLCPEYMGQHLEALPPLTGDGMVDPHWVAAEYDNISTMKRAISELEKSARALANQDSLPGYELVERKGVRKYSDTLLKTLRDAGRYDLIEERVKSIKALDAAGLSDLLEADGHIYTDTILKLEKKSESCTES